MGNRTHHQVASSFNENRKIISNQSVYQGRRAVQVGRCRTAGHRELTTVGVLSHRWSRWCCKDIS